jgi:phosphatidylserine/phosphatidylglycerophosphate/cardiolipin synthase-like enzyme
VTRDVLTGARESVVVGIYDFDAEYVRDLLTDLHERGVRVTLMLDCDCLKGESEIFDELDRAGCECVPAPSCASASVASHFFSCSHEKVIVVDGRWTLVQSGNWTQRSIPRNESDGASMPAFVPGNRDMGLAVDSPDLARFFSDLLRKDIALERDNGGGQPRTCKPGEGRPVHVESPTQPPRLFASQRFEFDRPIEVQPVLSPDNYMAVVPALLESARTTIRIEQQYIKTEQPEVRLLLDAIDTARRQHTGLEIRIVLAKGFSNADLQSEIAGLEARGLMLGDDVRILNPHHFTHCHNKLIVVDDEWVLVSSQNWSDTAVTKNREAGLLVDSPEIARYFAGVFDADWQDAMQVVTPPTHASAEATPGYVSLSRGDLIEV